MESKHDWYDFWNFFYLGNYQAAVEACPQGLEQSQWPREVLLALVRLRLSQRDRDSVQGLQGLFTDEWTASVIKVSLQVFMNGRVSDDQESVRSAVLGGANALESVDEPGRLLATTALLQVGLYADALEILPLACCRDDAESRACRVALWLQLNRLDRAQLEFRAFEVWAEQQLIGGDHAAIGTLLQITKTMLVLASDHVEEIDIESALMVCTELAERYGQTAKLLNLIYCCSLRLGRKEAAERTLQEALALEPNDPDTLANAAAHSAAEWMVTAACAGAADIVNQYTERLRVQAPWHPWLRCQETFEKKLDECLVNPLT
ncbi:hypothetical protein CCYA_CCYA16G4059 [Cyanidiococcus yangmingshanensis]|nr:hypothetical protein CCYA_CCYA16G4059 [Cyanidiococcus yangmingshanensis]